MSPNSSNSNNVFNANSDGNLDWNDNGNNAGGARPLDNFLVFMAKAIFSVCIDKPPPCTMVVILYYMHRAKVSTRTGDDTSSPL